MRRISKKLGALLLSVLLILSLAACGSPGETSNYSTESAAATGQQDSALEATTPQKETESEQEQRADSIPDDTTSNEIVSGSDVLVVYFSRTGEQYTVGVIDKGNTAIVAEMIIERTGADSFEILPEEDYYRCQNAKTRRATFIYEFHPCFINRPRLLTTNKCVGGEESFFMRQY